MLFQIVGVMKNKTVKIQNIGTNQQEIINNLVENKNYRYWLGGFIEGEGSLTLSITKNNKLSLGFAIQPEFNVAQHISGLHILNSFKLLFNNLGNVHKKSGSENVWVYVLKGTFNVKTYILPFFSFFLEKKRQKSTLFPSQANTKLNILKMWSIL